jgi:eukaryotic-like serine/threonine-protein kinase
MAHCRPAGGVRGSPPSPQAGAGGPTGAPGSLRAPRYTSPLAHDGTSRGSDWTGRVIDQRYRIVRPLGEGAMGSVYVADHLTLHKQVALKVVRAEFAGNRELLARFAREALAGSRIEHPSVVPSLDYGPLQEGGAYLVMPLVPGAPLTDLLHAHGRLPWQHVAHWGAQIADALAAAWAQGFVHRDLKPDNILIEARVDSAPVARIIDFGVARLCDQLSGTAVPAAGGAPALTQEGAIIGTPGYMAPEQALGRTASHAADLYSLGVVMWEALVGQPRWRGESIRAVLQAQLTEKRPSARDASGDASIPEALDRLVERLLAARPEERPGDARQVRDELRALLRAPAAGESAARAVGKGPLARPGVWLALIALLAAGASIGAWLAL